MELTELDHLPAGLLERPASALHHMLNGPTLIHLEGKNPNPLFVTVLQHGNEITGWEAVRRLLKSHYEFDQLPRSLSILIGNTHAAKYRLRRLDDQLDFNRCWPGGKFEDSEVGKMFRQVTDRVRAVNPIAAIDFHNNTGLNPHYAAINRIRPEFLRLASYFSSKVVYFTMPEGTQSLSLSRYCPSTTLECGQAGEVHGTDHCIGFLETCMHLDVIPTTPIDADEVHLFHMVATVRVHDEALFGFGHVPTEIAFRENLDVLNFQELPSGISLGDVNGGPEPPLIATDIDGLDVTKDYFRFDRRQIETVREIMPSMLTLDRRVIQQDCLCYLMERIHFEDHIEVTDHDPLPEGIRRSDRPGEPAL
ncbi:MAG: succinylglutamate desuccinylase/aspartoacylase family protein [Gammaproteobacteria bacterium]|nr:succinylglutamate desuccinylase/aspartoacylase family protein [Gammaproteobacteria bacterium]MBT8075773.1 succinylglutamate desuccinylase/aspartoacylase family protein [Gammaproteobacteria bacterium]NNK99064.1 peptidase M14 [Xanthomonadales bacterium]